MKLLAIIGSIFLVCLGMYGVSLLEYDNKKRLFYDYDYEVFLIGLSPFFLVMGLLSLYLLFFY